MKAKTYVRVTQFRLPPNTGAAHLHLLASVCEVQTILEGYLLNGIAVGERIRIRGHVRDGGSVAEDYTTSVVTRIEQGYVLTLDSIFQILRVPGPAAESASAQPASKAPTRTTVARREYIRERESVFAQMEALAPDLALIQALFRLYQEELARARRDVPDKRTGEPISAVDLHAEFTTLLDALLYRYSGAEKHDREREIWVAGHKVLAALWAAILIETAFLQERGHLALFTGCHARLSRMLVAWQYFATLLPEGVCSEPE